MNIAEKLYHIKTQPEPKKLLERSNIIYKYHAKIALNIIPRST